MKKFLVYLGAVVLTGVLAASARADEEKVALDKLPKAVVDAVKARFPGAEMKNASKETEDGKTVYEVTLKNKDQNIDVTLTPEGDITEIEKEIAAKDLPKAVAKALEEKYPKAEFKIIEEVIKVKGKKEKLEYYELLLVTAEKKKLEVQIDPDGKVLKEEKKDTEKD